MSIHELKEGVSSDTDSFVVLLDTALLHFCVREAAYP